jgi:hypothetical protein
VGNLQTGHVRVEAKGKAYTLRFSIDAICQVEERSGRTFPEIAADMEAGKISLSLTRFLLWGALREEHPEIGVKDAGELMTAFGGVQGAIEKISAAMAAAFPVPDENPQNPPKPDQAGTGPAS